MKAPRILLISDNLPPVIGGSGVVYDALARALPENMVVLTSTHTPDGTEKPGWRAVDQGAPYRCHRWRHVRLRQGGGLIGRLRDLWQMALVSLKVWRLAGQERADVIVIGELVSLGWLALALKRLGRRPVVIYTHTEEVTQAMADRLGGLRPRVLGAADHVVAVSRYCARAVRTLAGLAGARISVISNGVDLGFFTPGAPERDVRAPHGLTAEHRLIVAAGRHVPRKGFDRLIEAMPAITARHPDSHLLLVGDGPQTADLKALAADTCPDHVHFTGPLDRATLRDHYRTATLFAMPNRTMPDGDTEGFGLVFLEAAACGVPSVGGLGGGAVEAIRHERTGLSIDGTDIAAIAKAITRLLGDERDRRRLADGALAHARSQGWADKAAEFQTIMADLVADPAHRRR
ncbi:glycosyltransferase family 4 protein [Yunchengibacter salinarum]|uniref:glycosyltransferase family 4 protein n=1 Tax=Yunchengibacter salinarum TaxID=3133399 RepID=UPI0035B616B5